MSLSSFAFMSETLNAESCFKKLCIFLTGGAYAPYAPCLSTTLDIHGYIHIHRCLSCMYGCSNFVTLPSKVFLLHVSFIPISPSSSISFFNCSSLTEISKRSIHFLYLFSYRNRIDQLFIRPTLYRRHSLSSLCEQHAGLTLMESTYPVDDHCVLSAPNPW